MFLLGVLVGFIYCLLSLWAYIDENTKLYKCLTIIIIIIIIVIEFW